MKYAARDDLHSIHCALQHKDKRDEGKRKRGKRIECGSTLLDGDVAHAVGAGLVGGVKHDRVRQRVPEQRIAS